MMMINTYVLLIETTQEISMIIIARFVLQMYYNCGTRIFSWLTLNLMYTFICFLGRGSSKKKYYDGSDDDFDDDWDDEEEEYKPKKRTPSKPKQKPKPKPKPRRRARDSSDDELDSEEELPKKSKRGGKSRGRRQSSEDEMPSTSSRATRAARVKRKSYGIISSLLNFLCEYKKVALGN